MRECLIGPVEDVREADDVGNVSVMICREHEYEDEDEGVS